MTTIRQCLSIKLKSQTDVFIAGGVLSVAGAVLSVTGVVPFIVGAVLSVPVWCCV